MCAWYNIQNDNIAAEAAERPATGKCGFCGARDIKIHTRMKIYFSEFEIEDADCCYSCYHKNSKATGISLNETNKISCSSW